jgi:hypothetical protein
MAKKTAKPEIAETQDQTVTASPQMAEDAAQPAEAPNLSSPAIQAAIEQGKAIIAEGKSKADAARAIYAAISTESKDVIVAAFVEGATLTPKGALTYWYNNRRKATKAS